ncbi:hypothetical protein Zmor_018296 [Zophobas morio]|uniref:Gustatory receptor n=1 Tax=Zophobas morio TaxID=2755281 RepID=A0AA38I6U7_9CUCU|nr:hypothetical protein Zmor_018296 [Zophobas morio]
MCFKLLNTYLKVGKFFALTPPSIETDKNTTFRKILQVFMILLIITCVTISMYFRNTLYLQYNLAKITVCLLTDFVLCLFCCRTVFETSKVSQWIELINCLKQTSCLIEETDNKKEERIQWKFIVPQVAFWIISIFTTIYWFTFMGVLIFEQYGFEVLQNYIQWFYTFYVHTIIGMIQQRYEALKHHFENSFGTDNKNLNQMGYYACTLKETVNRFNSLYGWSLLLLITLTTLQFLNYLEYNLQSQEFGTKNVTQTRITHVLTMLLSFIPTVMLLLKCDNVMDEFENIVFLESKSSTQLLDPRIREEVDRFGHILATNLPQFSAARFIVLGRTTLLGIFGTVASFFIVITTFEPKTRSNILEATANVSLSRM